MGPRLFGHEVFITILFTCINREGEKKKRMPIGEKEGFPYETKDKLSVGAHLFTNKKTLRNTDNYK